MCLFDMGGGDIPKAEEPKVLPEPEQDRTELNEAYRNEQDRLRARAGKYSTVATSSMGLTEPANTSGKSLLGQ